MEPDFWMTLINNGALLLALFVAYELYNQGTRQAGLFSQIVTGIFSATVCLAIMMTPLYLYPGIVFDTRSILLSVTALTFGLIPSFIAAATAIILRIIMGGDGMITGLSVIISSVIIGLIWRKLVFGRILQNMRWLSFYIMGLIVHIVMLACMLFIPSGRSIEVINRIAIPVLVLYPIVTVLLCMLLVLQQDRQKYLEELVKSDIVYKNITENISDVVWVTDFDLNILYVTPSATKMLGYSLDLKNNINIRDFAKPESLDIIRTVIKEEMLKENDPKAPKDRVRIFDLEQKPADGSINVAQIYLSFIRDKFGRPKQILGVSRDITDWKIAESALKESERVKSTLLSNLPGFAYRSTFAKDWVMEFVSDGCYDLTGYRADQFINNREVIFNDLISENYREFLNTEWTSAYSECKQYKLEYEITTASGDKKYVYDIGKVITDENGLAEALEGVVVDITEAKHHAEQLNYMREHDVLTGLFNREFYESHINEFENVNNLPITIIVSDINGVRLINDAFGHKTGDKLLVKTAEILMKCSEGRGINIRIGGDEFATILPKTNRDEALKIIDSITAECEDFNSTTEFKELSVRLSLGYEVKTDADQNISDVIKTAEEHMYKKKLLDHNSHHNTLITSVMATMLTRSQETESHANRLAELTAMIGRKLGFTQTGIDELILLSMLHDIGKIGIDDRILKKPGKLNAVEWEAMKKHPELGYKIAMSSPEFEPVAEYILCHHERWDGGGYPRGIAGEDIPIQSRILAVVDAYDAMTEDRVYRKARAREDALAEITANAGTQFDPTVANIFVKMILGI